MKNRNSPFHGAGGYSGLRARDLTFKKVVKQVMRDRLNNRFMVQMENMLRRIVQEELDRRLQPLLSSSRGPMERSRSETPSSRPQYKLRFINSPPLSIFTGFKIETEDRSPLLIELVDATTNTRVVSEPLSSSRVEIVPLNADFTEERWTGEIFKRNILKQRERKRPLLTGDLTVTLKNGVGVIAGDVSFSDNSSWTRSRKFRLGARLTGGGAMEARSKAFNCKDKRGESYKKHHTPYPGDEVWRLKKIAKDGVSATRLGEKYIFTVKDFRRWYTINPIGLYNILASGISKKTWDAIVSHAMRCVLDETECYIYNANANGVSLLFNSFYEVIKASLSVGGPFLNIDELTEYQQLLDQSKLEAYENLSHFRPVDGRDFEDNPQRSLQCPQNPGFGIACPGSQHIDFQGTSDPSGSSTSLCLTAAGSMVHPEMLMSFHNHYDMSSNWPSPGTQQAIEMMCLTVSGTEEAGIIDVRFENVNLGSPRARWCKVKAALKIREVWKHTTARKRGKACKKLSL